jgi:hypothetical protein
LGEVKSGLAHPKSGDISQLWEVFGRLISFY